MATYTLTGDLNNAVGLDLTNGRTAPRAWLIPYNQATAEAGDVNLGSVQLTLDSSMAYSQTGVPAGGWQVHCRYYDPNQSQMVSWYSPFFNVPDYLDLATVVADAAQAFTPVRPAIDHGNQSGSLTITSEYGLHEINLSDDLDLTVSGPAGADMAVRLTGTGNVVTLVNAQWDTAAVAAPATILFTHWTTAGWRASGTGSVPDDIAPGWDYADDFTAADTTAVVGRTMPKGALAWVAMAGESLGGAEANATITSNAVLNNDGSISTRGASAVAPALGMDVQVTYDIDTGTAATAERRAYIWLGAVDLNNTLSVQVRADGSLLCFKGGTVAVTLAGTTTGVPQSGTLRMKYLGTALTITHGAGTATATVATGTGFTGTGRRIGFAVREDGSIISDFKARVAT